MLVSMLLVNAFSLNCMLLVEKLMLYYSQKKSQKVSWTQNIL